MEARRCLIRYAGEDTETEPMVGYLASGLFCAQQFRGNSMATDMMINLLTPWRGHPINNETLRFAKIYDPQGQLVPYA